MANKNNLVLMVAVAAALINVAVAYVVSNFEMFAQMDNYVVTMMQHHNDEPLNSSLLVGAVAGLAVVLAQQAMPMMK